MSLVETDVESIVGDAPVDVCGEMIQDLKRKMAQGLLGPLDKLSRVGLGKGNTQVFTDGLPWRLFRGLDHLAVVGFFGKRVEVCNQTG